MIPFNYTVTRELHATDAAVAYAGHRKEDRAPFTLKIPSSACPTPRQVALLKHEHAVLAGLTLPGVLGAIALETWEHGLALILEPFDGEPLDRLARARPLAPREVVALAVRIADALGAVHGCGVVHRDIRPENILVGAGDGQVKLTSFGIAARLAAPPHTEPHTEADVSRGPARAAVPKLLEGTLAYMSPEQTGRIERGVDHRADLYSFGVTLYELLTSTLPFQTTDPIELIHSHVARTPTPPHALSPAVPRVVSEIVMKLLAKAAEDRYQTAHGLKADLEECLSRWDADGGPPPFPLGRRDGSEELRAPQRLYGREPERAALLAALGRAGGGAAELVLLAGDPGVGKTTLAGELQRAAARGGALVATGRFDQASRRVPYGPVMQPFRELCREILAARAEVLAAFQQRLLAALGDNGQVLADLIPELSFVIGPQPDVPELGPAAAQNRLRLAFQDLVRAFAGRARPLVLFFDDLQWADATSLSLIQALFTDPERAHLLVLGATRGGGDGDDDGERDDGAGLPLSRVRAALAGGVVSTLELGALGAAEVTGLVAEALSCEPARATPLAALVREKTGGNPLFLRHFLQSLRAPGLLTFDARAGAWAWDLAAIGAAPVTDNVISFMERKLDRLSPASRRAIAVAACVGREPDLATLELLLPGERAAALLEEAKDEGLLVAIGEGENGERDGGPGAPRSVRFVHDRVQQAAYASLPEPERQAIHLQLGQLARERLRGERTDEALFEAVQHLNLGAPRITAPRERAELAAMDLGAGRRARSRAAYPAASGFFEAGLAALPPGSFEHDHALAFALHTEAAESAYLSGQFARAEALFSDLPSHARTDLDRARIHGMRVTLYLTQGRLDDALRVGRAALALLDIDLPEDEPARRAAADAELAAARAALGKRRVSELLDAPEMSDDRARAALELLMSLTMPATLTSPALGAFVVARQVNLSLARGHSSVSAYGYMAYATIEARVFRKYDEAFELGTLALELNARFDNAALSCRLHFMFGAYISLFSKHLLSSLDHLAQAAGAGLRTGDLTYLSQTAVHTALVRIGLGDECASVRAEVGEALALMERTRDELAGAALTGIRRALDGLMGAARGRDPDGDDALDEAAYEAKIAAPGYGNVALIHYALRQQLCFLHEDYEGALRLGALGEAKLQGGAGHHIATELYFYTCLALLSPAIARNRQPATAPVSLYRDRLAEWGERCPDNYRHKYLLIRAESSRAAGEELAAMKLYDQAIEAAKVDGFLRDEALANELCAKFHLASGREKIAHLYMTDAYHGYLRWGATAKMDQLAKAYPHLVAQAALGRMRGRAADSAAPAAGVERPEALDTLAVMRAARTISGEIVLDRLLDRLLRILLGSAGGQRGTLLLARGGQGGRLTVEAQITVEPDAVRVGPSTPLEAAGDLAVAVVQYVARTQEPVVLRDASADERFARDPYVIAAGVRSVICLAMSTQGRLSGVLYLENNAAAGAFSTAQLELCGLLASQAAIAVENALLYGQVQETSTELRRSRDALEAEVTRRTEELRDANDRLTEELGSRHRTEQERTALQEEVIRVQRDRLYELSAPLIPITDRIMVLPLVGDMDPARAAQVLETTVEGAAASGAAVVIIDVTGAKRVDAAVAAALLQTAAALRLLGARVVITGIRADAARTLVESDLDLSAVVTRGTLQGGLAYALRVTGGDPRWLEQKQRS